MAKVDEPTPAPEPLPEAEELSAEAASKATLAVSPELVAGSVPEYLRVSLARIRAGETGVLPVIAGMLLVSILFQSLNSQFLTARNLVDLLVQAQVPGSIVPRPLDSAASLLPLLAHQLDVHGGGWYAASGVQQPSSGQSGSASETISSPSS